MDVHKEFLKIRNTLGEMEEHDKALWCLLSLCRANQPFLILAKLDECGEMYCFEEFLERCKRVVLDREPGTFSTYVEILKHVSCVCAGMYFTEDGEVDYLPADDNKSMTDLGEGFVPAHFGNIIAAIGQLLESFPHVKNAGNGAEVIMGVTFEDYFYDKYGTDDVPEVIQEIKRIWNDYKFILRHPTRTEVEAKIEEYKAHCTHAG